MKQQETELKFRLKELPSGLDKGHSIKQFYFDISSPDSHYLLNQYFKSDSLDWSCIQEARLRIINDSEHFLTLKSYGTISRDEYEVEISREDELKILYSHNVIGEVQKERFRIPIESSGMVFEIDVYAGKLEGLFIAEVDYDPNKSPNKEDILSLAKAKLGDGIVDVTEDQRYKNRNLATAEGFPDFL